MSDLLQAQQKQKIQLKQEEQDFYNGESVTKYIDGMKIANVAFAGEEHQVHYESEEQQIQTEAILSSDHALQEYYEKNDPQMLQGLKSKSFFNFPGKKAEKKRLRKAYVNKISMQTKTKAIIDEFRRDTKETKMTDKQILDFKRQEAAGYISNYFSLYENYDEQKSSAIMYKVYNMDPVTMDRYSKLIKKQLDEKALERSKEPLYRQLQLYSSVMKMDQEGFNGIAQNFLYQTREEQKEAYVNQFLEDPAFQAKLKEKLDGDLSGEDTEEVRQIQTMQAKVADPAMDYQAYRLQRRVKGCFSDIELPKAVAESLKQGKAKYTEGDIKRTCSTFMKTVKYKEEDGKQVPATEQDQKNLEFNEKWGTSLLSDKEEDWSFRFHEMENYIDTAFTELKPWMDEVVRQLNDQDMNHMTAEIDEERFLEKCEKLIDYSGWTLCISGVTHLNEQNGLFKSNYFKKLSEDRQKELNQKNDAVSSFLQIFKTVVNKHGAKVENGLPTKAGEAAKMAPYIPMFIFKLKMDLSSMA